MQMLRQTTVLTAQEKQQHQSIQQVAQNGTCLCSNGSFPLVAKGILMGEKE